MRIFRTVIVLAGILALLPSPPESEGAATASDAASFCQRQPLVCETAAYIGTKIEIKSKYALKLLFQDDTAEAADPMITGSTSRRRANQSTLRLEDLIPEWRGPVKRRKS